MLTIEKSFWNVGVAFSAMLWIFKRMLVFHLKNLDNEEGGEQLFQQYHNCIWDFNVSWMYLWNWRWLDLALALQLVLNPSGCGIEGTIWERSYENQYFQNFLYWNLICSIQLQLKERHKIVMFNIKKGNTVFISCHMRLCNSWH